MIEVQELVKWYGPTLAVDHVSFDIPKGQIVGFLGPNGAGKSTTLRILTGYLPSTSGSARIDGQDVLKESAAVRRKIGYLPENTPLYTEMRVEEFLQFRGKLHGMSRNDRRERINIVCDRCGLAHLKRRVIRNLSKGNRQRVGLAQALLHNPQVLILDEPTAGLDPNQIGHVRTLIGELADEHTIILSTHILPEVEKSADRVIIIAGGRIVAQGTPNELRRNVAGEQRVIVGVKAEANAVSHAIQGMDSVQQVTADGNRGWSQVTVTPRDGQDIREQIGGVMQKNNWQVRELRHEGASLEQFFVHITAQQQQQVAAQASNQAQTS